MGSGNSGQMTCFCILLLFLIFVVNSLAIEYFSAIHVFECVLFIYYSCTTRFDWFYWWDRFFFVFFSFCRPKSSLVTETFSILYDISYTIQYTFIVLFRKNIVGIRPSFSCVCYFFESHSSLYLFDWVVHFIVNAAFALFFFFHFHFCYDFDSPF